MDMSPQEYQAYVKGMQKKSPLLKDMALAFGIGGAICVVGQLIQTGWLMLLPREDAASATLKLRYRKANDTEIETAEISMDYALFEMVSAMKEGYRPTVQDKNQHADFVSFVQRIIEFGNKASRIVLVPKENEHDYKVIFEQTDFGYEFKVVQA